MSEQQYFRQKVVCGSTVEGGSSINHNIFLLCLIAIAVITLTACNSTDLMNEERTAYFHNRVNESILDRGSVEIMLSSLTKFNWNNVCFKQNGKIKLIFSLEGKNIHTIRLEKNQYLINEGYVPRSPERKCYSNEDFFEIQTIKIGPRNVVQFLELKSVL